MHIIPFGRLHWCRPLEKFMTNSTRHMALAKALALALPVALPVAHSRAEAPAALAAPAALVLNTAGADIHIHMQRDNTTVRGRRPT